MVKSLLNTFGLMAQVSLFVLSAEPLITRLPVLLTSQSGTTMEAVLIKLSLTSLRLSLSLLLIIVIHSDKVIISLLSVRPSTGLIILAKSSCPQTQISDTLQRKFGMTQLLRQKKLGTELNKNTLLFHKIPNLLNNPSDGPTMVIPVLKVPIIAPLVQTYHLVVQLLIHTIKLVYMLVSKFLVQTLRLCQANGSIKLVLATVLTLEINFGFHDIFSVVLLKIMVLMSPLLLNFSLTGMVQDATQTTQPKQ